MSRRSFFVALALVFLAGLGVGTAPGRRAVEPTGPTEAPGSRLCRAVPHRPFVAPARPIPPPPPVRFAADLPPCGDEDRAQPRRFRA
ncbi:MAG: hypothetical protein GWN99_00770 [Gemmatimonadetes bacterium]|uniref:Uncharacterized protein n=1 Tax=Candidatus Kutchimonas denitrificans TaxID=3056748 RepID=A0AAE4Z7G2_9BACT|nr:hypothetical protein [Gemmatimonadota bacterium]NIR73641.1 hypothetical protein [Candidatus Kutchimonas denitrificans]NIR99600.1 hypothetical protein [Gemmatimonadota bacterium]NIT65220.1 hypothetical protein [Gemmatimonadota bacterium]NIV23753.1 hypothetical protein [Gemmatimonadota bacterium]